MKLQFENLFGDEIVPYIDDLAALRIAVFREFPYLYDGNMEYERGYLGKFAASLHSYVILARDPKDGAVVGASTALPLSDADDAFQKPFRDAGLDPEDYYYLAESVMLPEYRGLKAGRYFFEEREAQAAFLAYPQCCFCAVVRPASHPDKPAKYRSLGDFWKRRGYKAQPGLEAAYSWKDVGEAEASAKSMQFWTRRTKGW